MKFQYIDNYRLIPPPLQSLLVLNRHQACQSTLNGLDSPRQLNQCTANQDVHALKQKSSSIFFFQITQFKFKLETIITLLS